MEREELVQKLASKWILLDTNILISLSHHSEAFIPLLDIFKDAGCELCSIDFIEFEYLRDAFLPSVYTERKNKLLTTQKIPLPPDFISSAIEISQVYAHANIKTNQISVVDCMIAVIARKYHDNLFLLSNDQYDFPPIVFDRLHIFPIDGGSEILTPAIYHFNTKKFDKRLEQLKKIV